MVQIFFGLKNNFQTSLIFFPLSQSMVMNLRQIKNKNETGLKSFKPKNNSNHSIYTIFGTNTFKILCRKMQTSALGQISFFEKRSLSHVP